MPFSMSGMPLIKFLLQEQRKCPESSGSFTSLFSDIVVAAKLISRAVNKAELIDILGATGGKNVQGEEVQKLDEFANSAMLHTMEHSSFVLGMASEEMDGIVKMGGPYSRGNYLILFDPLDGSSNIDVNISVGTIFSILKTPNGHDAVTEKDFLRPGVEQVCAGYVLYGSSTMFVYTTGNGVHGFTLDPSVGEFLLSHESIRIPEKGKIYSINEGNSAHWFDGTTRYIQRLKSNSGYSARYVGSLVSDFHRNLLKGGVFLYPADKKLKKGKLRLLYEANPLSFIVEQAGGMSSTGDKRVMEIVPEELHQRVSLIIGSKADVEEAALCWQAGQ